MERNSLHWVWVDDTYKTLEFSITRKERKSWALVLKAEYDDCSLVARFNTTIVYKEISTGWLVMIYSLSILGICACYSAVICYKNRCRPPTIPVTVVGAEEGDIEIITRTPTSNILGNDGDR